MAAEAPASAGVASQFGCGYEVDTYIAMLG